MKASYFASYLESKRQNEKIQTDMRPFFREFVAWDNAEFKGKFLHAGELLYLLPLREDVYLFVQTRDQEAIKRIQRKTLEVADIGAALDADDSVGFASYVLVERDFVGFATRVLSPRSPRFSNFVNRVLEALGLEFEYRLRALTHELGRDEAQNLSVVSSFSVEIPVKSGAWDRMTQLLAGGGDVQTMDLGEIEVTFKPSKRGANNREVLRGVLNTLDASDIAGLDARAKIELADRLGEFTIVGAGGIRDNITADADFDIAAEIAEKARLNRVLQARLLEFRESEDFSRCDSLAAAGFAWNFPSSGGAKP